jgi:hypothetical protein
MLLEALSSVSAWVYRTAVVRPIVTLYRHGPVAVGMWGGAHASDVCARISRVDAAFWDGNPAECDALIERDTAGWVILVGTVLYVYLIARGVGTGIDLAMHRLFGPGTVHPATCPPR